MGGGGKEGREKQAVQDGVNPKKKLYEMPLLTSPAASAKK